MTKTVRIGGGPNIGEMPKDQVEAVLFCFGPRLSKWYCRAHAMTGPYNDPPDPHAGLDHICGLRKGHKKNRGVHRCVRCGQEF